jgi:hypothetical protein
VLVFSIQLCELLPLLTFSGSPPPPPPHPKLKYSINRQCVAGRGWGEMLSCVGDDILQEFNTLFLTRFRTYKIARPPQKIPRRGGGFRQINTCYKVPLQVNFFYNDICHCFLSVIFLRYYLMYSSGIANFVSESLNNRM